MPRGEQSSWSCWQDSQGLSDLLLPGDPWPPLPCQQLRVCGCLARAGGSTSASTLHSCAARACLQNSVPAPCGAGKGAGKSPNGFAVLLWPATQPAHGTWSACLCWVVCWEHCIPDPGEQLLWDSVLLRLNAQPPDKHLQKEEFPLWDGLAYELKQANALKSILGCCSEELEYPLQYDNPCSPQHKARDGWEARACLSSCFKGLNTYAFL